MRRDFSLLLGYFRCLLTSLVISNNDTRPLPPKTGLSFSSELIIRWLFLSCKPLRLMYAQIFLVTSVRGMPLEPTTAASGPSGVIGFINAALGFRLKPLLATLSTLLSFL